jgi:protein kinase X
MEEALQKLKELKLRRHSGESEEEDDDLEGSGKYNNDDVRAQEYEDEVDSHGYPITRSARDTRQYENSYRSSKERHSNVQQRGEEVKQNSERRITIHDFDFLSTLGTGTFGRVRLVKFKHDTTCEPLALKMLKKTEIIRLKQIDHVKSEKRILETIHHPFIVELKGTFQTESHVFMLLDYACGGELFSLLRREGRFANDVGLFFASEIVLAFEYLHGKDIAYRDLKPENLLVDKDGHCRITDFGFAKVVKDKTFTLCGTPEYLAPEIIQSKGHNKFVDWWALGVLIFEMLAGYPPFYDDNPLGIYQKILDGYYEFPPYIEPKARDLIKSFLTADKSIRLGCNKRGSEEVKDHKWFKGVDWDIVTTREIPPPWVPKVRNNTDTQYFEKYPDSVETPSVPTKAQQEHFNYF